MTGGKATKNKGNSLVTSRRRKFTSITTTKTEPRLMSKLNAKQTEEIDTALGRWFFGCNIPFNVVESKLFKKFISCLIPSDIYKPPSRKTLSTTILDRIHKDIVAERVSINGSEGVLLIDGWKNSSSNKQNVVCTVHTVNSKSIFLNSWDLTGISETGMELARIVGEAKTLSKDKYNIDIYAVMSDNASNMVKMGNNINIWHTTCHSHSGNLLAKALVPHKFAQDVNRLLRELKSSGNENEIIKKGGSRIILACDTRWCSYRDSFRCLLKNFSIIKKLVEDKKIILKNENYVLFNNESFEVQLQDYIMIFDPICKLINTCQKSDSSLADACQEWLQLNIPADNDIYEEIVGARLDKVLTPIVLAANLLHPQYQGKYFRYSDQRKMACEFLEQQLTAEDSINNNALEMLTEMNKNINTYNDLKDIKFIMNKALTADYGGAKSKSICFYENACQQIRSNIKVTSDPTKKKKLEELEQSIKERMMKLNDLVDGLEINDYLNNVGIFGNLKNKNYQSPTAFWNVAGYSYPKLSSLALKLLKIPAASAQLERLFSFWAFIHSDIRNRLSVDRSMKLVDVYYSLKMSEQHDHYYDDLSENEI